MESEQKPSGLSALDRYQFETQILTDPLLGNWFLAICNGEESPSVHIPEETLALMEQRGLIRKSDFGWSLRPDGRDFARKLGLQAGPAPVESDPTVEAFPSSRVGKLKDVWLAYRKNKTEPLRNILMEKYLHLVRYNAERIYAKLPDEIDLDDLMSAGIFGLMDAINAYDPKSGAKFETYCSPRIRSAILEELRNTDWVPRPVRSRAQMVDSAAKQTQNEMDRSPTNAEIAKRLSVPMNEFEKLAKGASAKGLVSFSLKWFETDSNKDVREIDILEDKSGADPVREIMRKDLKDHITSLPRRERLIIILLLFLRDDDKGNRADVGNNGVARKPDA